MATTVLRATAVGDWEACGDTFYAREHLYDMQWQEVELEHMRVCCASFGGPIATVRDERQMVVVKAGAARPVVRIFSASGQQLGSFLWEDTARGKLVAWGWAAGESSLITVGETGRVAVYSLKGSLVREATMGAAVESEGVAQALVAQGSGAVAVLTRAGAVWVLADVLGPAGADAGAAAGALPTRLADPPIAPTPELLASCRLAVLDPRATLSGSVEVLLSAGSGVVWQLDELSCAEHAVVQRPASPITAMCACPGGAMLALFTADGRLLVVSTDFSRQLSEFETRADAPPVAMEWCGSDAVVLQWPELLLAVGPYGDHASWSTAQDGRVVLVPEVDGVRVVSNTRHELLRKVPQALSEVFRPGSTSPATQLWDAREALDAGLPRADKVLRSLSPSELVSAVTTCIESAGHDLSAARQKALLRAAAYGRAFCDASFPPHLAHDTAQRLRLLNALRDGAGLPLTMAQLLVLGIPAVVARLVAAQQWVLAVRIATSLRHAFPTLLGADPASVTGGAGGAGSSRAAATGGAVQAGHTGAGPSPVLAALASGTATSGLSSAAASAALQEFVLSQWACAKISAAAAGQGAGGQQGDAEIKEELMPKLRTCPTIKFAPLAAHAQSVGRRRLALLLLEEEASCALQVPLLLSLAGRGGTAGGRADLDEGEGGTGEDALVRALRRAVEAGDTDLVYLVLFTAYRSRSLQEFWQLVSSRTLPRNLFLKYCRAKEPELLETLLATTGQAVELADLQVSRALAAWAESHSNHTANEAALTKLTSSLSDASHKYATSRDHAFQSKAAADGAALLREQARLERELGGAGGTAAQLVGLSLAGTLRALIRLGAHKQAAALRKQFGMPDARFWWVRLRTLAEARDWEALDALASEKKSPVGWEPFLEVARAWGAPRDVQARLISRMPDTVAKAEEYASIDYAREAAEVAARLRDGDLLRRISSAVSASSPAGLAVQQIRERFFGGAGGGSSGAGGAGGAARGGR